VPIDKTSSTTRTRASYFEREVPLEVLESIFWHSENINLPLSSLRFGWVLSGRPTLRQTFINAFAPTWDAWHGYVQTFAGPGPRTFSLDGVEADPGEWAGNPEFQSALLRQPWADIEMILESEQFWCNRFARDRLSEPARLWGQVRPRIDTADSLQPESLVRDEFIHDYAAFRQAEEKRLPLQASDINTSSTYVLVHKDTQIPDDLLTGPWPDEKSLQKLFWLTRAGCQLAEDQTWEVTLEGFRNAVWGRSGASTRPSRLELSQSGHKVNLTVVRIFVALGAFTLWPHWVMREELYKLVEKLQDTTGHTSTQLHAYLHAALEVKRVYPDPGRELPEESILALVKFY